MAFGLSFRDSVGLNNTGTSGSGGLQTDPTALPANTARQAFMIQNQGTNPLYVYFGTGCTSSVFNFILKGGTGAADGTGGSASYFDGAIYRGIVTIAGTSPSYSVTEL